MRIALYCVLALALAGAASADCTAPTSDPLSLSGVSGCSIVTTCQSTLCSCLGTSGSYPTCLASNTKSCDAVATCYAAYVLCLTTTSSVRSNSSNNCSTYGSTVYVAQLAAAASSTLNSSSLYASCSYQGCLLANQTSGVSSCTGSSLLATVCNSATLLSTSTTVAPSTAVMAVTLRLKGANWSYALSDSTKLANLRSALLKDLATLWNISSIYIGLGNLSVGSLIVPVSLYDGSGQAVASLASAINAVQGSSSWLTSTTSVYSSVGTDSITTESVTTLTAAPGQTLAPGATASVTTAPSSSATVGVVAALVTAAVALFVA